MMKTATKTLYTLDERLFKELHLLKLRQLALSFLLLIVFAFSSGAIPSHAVDNHTYKRVYDARTKQYYYVPQKTLSEKTRDKTTTALRNPIVKQAAIGTAVGVAAGALSDKSSAAKGAGVGALVGAGNGLLDTSRALDKHPMVKTSLKGAAIGTGASILTAKSKTKGAATGAAVGAGWHLFDNWFNHK